MKKTLLVLLLILVPGTLLAQQAPAKPATPEAAASAATETASPSPYLPQSQYAAPQLGHPLDPADVATLTGRAQTSVPAAYRVPYAPYAAPPVYFNYSSRVPLFGTPMFSPLGTQSIFFPRWFGGINTGHRGPTTVLPFLSTRPATRTQAPTSTAPQKP